MQQRQGHPAARWGFIFGGVMAILSAVIGVVELARETSSSGTRNSLALLQCLFFLITLGAFFATGWVASRHTAKVSTGTLAGLLAGAIGGVVLSVFIVIYFATADLSNFQYQLSQNGDTTNDPRTVAVTAGVILAFVIVLFYVGIGAGIGALGGLVGRAQAPANLRYTGMAYYPPGMYPGYPPMQGAYPPPPGYPPTGYSQPGQYPPPGAYPPQGAYPPPPGYQQSSGAFPPPPPGYEQVNDPSSSRMPPGETPSGS